MTKKPHSPRVQRETATGDRMHTGCLTGYLFLAPVHALLAYPLLEAVPSTAVAEHKVMSFICGRGGRFSATGKVLHAGVLLCAF